MILFCAIEYRHQEVIDQRNCTLTRVIKHNRVVTTFQTSGVNSADEMIQEFKRLTDSYIGGLRQWASRCVQFNKSDVAANTELESIIDTAHKYVEVWPINGDILDQFDSLGRSIPVQRDNGVAFNYHDEHALFHKFEEIIGDAKVPLSLDQATLFFHQVYLKWKHELASLTDIDFPGKVSNEDITIAVGTGYFYLEKWTSLQYISEHLHLTGDRKAKTRQFIFARDNESKTNLIRIYCERAEKSRKESRSDQTVNFLARTTHNSSALAAMKIGSR